MKEKIKFGSLIAALLVSFFLLTSFEQKQSAFYSTDLSEKLDVPLLADIKEGKKSIWVMSYSLSDPRLLHLLKEKKREGLDVKVIVDSKASPKAYWLEPDIEVFRHEGPALMHFKIAIIDDQIVWLGSTNMTEESFRNHSNLSERIESKTLATYIKMKGRSMTEEGLNKPLPPFFEGNFAFYFLPDTHDAPLKIKKMIREAKKSIKVAMYTFTREDFADTLIRAKERGVDVQVVMDEGMASNVNRRIYNHLKSHGIPLFLPRKNGLMHHKFMLIDDTILVHGSANWTRAAFTKNDDYFVVKTDLSPEEQQDLEKVWTSLKDKDAKKVFSLWNYFKDIY